MSQTRHDALSLILNRPKAGHENQIPYKPSEVFGSLVFDHEKMRNYLTKDSMKSLKVCIENRGKISKDLAHQVALGMKAWAMGHGATHYTHWFQPLNGLTAEKHDSFFELKDGLPVDSFSGSSLIQQEPDASSFPSGGIRSTFEARGYTAWDPSSPAFLMRTRFGLTLCVPTIFISYTGEALDYKAPLLRAVHLLEDEALAVCKIFHPEINKAEATLGVEQEYFLVDEAWVKSRPDLLLCKRTVLGSGPAKGQQLEDHYFGSIPERVQGFMAELEMEAHKLGIPLRTRHNEVAPSQYECAPQFESVNMAVDHNVLLMDLMDKVARKHHFRILLHEKPFDGVNGSGKHCNWSIGTDNGLNLLSPGADPYNNLLFLTFFVNTIKAVWDHADLLRSSVASASNDHRLGANEAPPAIISVFIGRHLTEILERLELETGGISAQGDKKEAQDNAFDYPLVPEIEVDTTDRNRTSPFAFTGNKFEFRAVGSSANPASPMIVLNTIVGNQLRKFRADYAEAMKTGGMSMERAIRSILKSYIQDSKGVLFEGNNYSDEWKAEAQRRGLSNLESTPDALTAFVSEKTMELFKNNSIFQENELHARYDIRLDIYVKQLQIESRTLGEMVLSQILPSAIEYQNELLLNYNQLVEAGMEDVASEQREFISRLSTHISESRKLVFAMIEDRKLANNEASMDAQARAYCEKVKPYFDKIRYHCNKLELFIDDRLWVLPKYREMLFIR